MWLASSIPSSAVAGRSPRSGKKNGNVSLPAGSVIFLFGSGSACADQGGGRGEKRREEEGRGEKRREEERRGEKRREVECLGDGGATSNVSGKLTLRAIRAVVR